jgi:hypothetical protein
MATCGGITSGATYDCTNPLQPGVNSTITLINKDDISVVTYDVTKTHLITGITLAAGGKQGYAFEGIRQSVDPQAELIVGTLSVGYDHIVNFQVFDISSDQKVNLEKLALSKVVAVIENMNVVGNADSVFEVYGFDAGLEVVLLTRLARDLETGGSFTVNLKTSDNEGKEAKLPLSFWDTDYATTKAKVDALLIPAT